MMSVLQVPLWTSSTVDHTIMPWRQDTGLIHDCPNVNAAYPKFIQTSALFSLLFCRSSDSHYAYI